MPSQFILNYYRDIIPDSNHFLEVANSPLPTCLWANEIKTTPDYLKLSFEKSKVFLQPLSWNSAGFRCYTQNMLGNSWQYLLGLCQIQEEVSMLPPLVLQPKPGECVLDLCAAPGNKTAQLAIMMKNQGTLIANDCNFGRLRALGQISKRMGLFNINLTIHDGTNFPNLNNYFDKVLADVPCSCEGTFRKGKRKKIIPNRQLSLSMARVQTNLLYKSILLCKPGGRILYSTCTFAPEENEGVINGLLKEYPGLFRIVPIHIPNFHYSQGLRQWQEVTYDDTLRHTVRVWPHQNNTGGFYLALLEKLRPSRENLSISKKIEKASAAIPHYLQLLADRFAIPLELFNRYRFIKQTNRGIYIINHDNEEPESLDYDVNGLFFMKTNIRYPKLTTAAAQLFAKHAQKNKVYLHEQQFLAYLNRCEISLSDQQARSCTDTGYVLVFYDGNPLGVGLYLSPRDNLGHRLQSMFPAHLTTN